MFRIAHVGQIAIADARNLASEGDEASDSGRESDQFGH
jgi:hypothetical protein